MPHHVNMVPKTMPPHGKENRLIPTLRIFADILKLAKLQQTRLFCNIDGAATIWKLTD